MERRGDVAYEDRRETDRRKHADAVRHSGKDKLKQAPAGVGVFHALLPADLSIDRRVDFVIK